MTQHSFENKKFIAPLIAIFLAVFLLSPYAKARADQNGPEFTDKTVHVDAGYYKLDWSGTKGGDFEVQKALSDTFQNAEIVYNGTDQTLFLSGLPNGISYFRVRRNEGIWSPPLVVTVQHHDLIRTFYFLIAGLIVFILTALVVWRGHTQTKDNP